MLADVMMCWYATNSAALAGMWSITIDKYMFHASIHDANEVIFSSLMLAEGKLNRK